MRRYKLLLCSILLGVFNCTQRPIETTVFGNEDTLPYQIPTAVINRIKNYTGGDDSSAYAITKPLEAVAARAGATEGIDHDGLKVLFVDLDGDFKLEIVLEAGVLEDKSVWVLQQRDQHWYCIFRKIFWQKYESKPLVLVNNSSNQKLFYGLEMGASGTGVYSEYVYFYKLIKGEVVEVLRLAKEVRASEAGTILDQSYYNTFLVEDWAREDAIHVAYNYELAPNSLAFDSDRIPLTSLAREGTLTYYWNAQQNRYLPNWLEIQQQISPQKIEALESLGKDSLLYTAFRTDIQEKIKRETNQAQQFWRSYERKVLQQFGKF
jgi:hypothetical protein